MSLLTLYILWLKIWTSGTCSLFSFLSSRRKTAPEVVWYFYLGGYGIWFLQSCFSAWNAYHGIQTVGLIRLLNEGVLNTIKMFLFMGGTVLMWRKYVNRER